MPSRLDAPRQLLDLLRAARERCAPARASPAAARSAGSRAPSRRFRRRGGARRRRSSHGPCGLRSSFALVATRGRPCGAASAYRSGAVSSRRARGDRHEVAERRRLHGIARRTIATERTATTVRRLNKLVQHRGPLYTSSFNARQGPAAARGHAQACPRTARRARHRAGRRAVRRSRPPRRRQPYVDHP